MKRSTDACRQLMLPLDEFLAGEAARRAPNRDARQLGECIPSAIRDVIERAGRPDHDEGSGGDSRVGPTDRPGGGKATRSETGPRLTGAETPASHAGAVSDSGGTIVDFLAAGLLRRQSHSGLMAVVMLYECPGSEDHGYASSETWIEF